MVDKYLHLEEILATKYRLEWDDSFWKQFFVEGGKKELVATYTDDDSMDKWSDEDAMMHWLSLGRTWYDEDFFEKRPERDVTVLKMRHED
jgi:hypothetical protein